MAKDVTRKCLRCGETKTFRADQKTCGCNGNKPVVSPAPAPPPESDERNGEERTVQKMVTKKIKTLAELAEICEIDTSEWEIYKWRCVAWQTGMKNPVTNKAFYSQQFSVSAWMRLKKNIVAAKDEIEELRKKAEKYSPKYPSFNFKPRTSSGNMVEYSIYDHHVGAMIWGKETGGADYDSKIAKKDWESALSYLVSDTKRYQPDVVRIVLGNDQQNIDNRAGTTEHGTPQTSDTRYQKMFSISRDLSIWGIDALASVAPRVEVVMCPGNHDALATWHLGDSLIAWFRKFKNISIDNRPVFRKYYQYGVNMILYTHGNKGKPENYGKVMASEQPAMWGKTLWREAHTGDKHHMELKDLGGAIFRILPSLRPPDAWTSENMYVGAQRAAEAYAWNYETALKGITTYSILDRQASGVN